ncbi:arylesterase [Ferrimonas gelatinilytica]|uniref:Arylesterase n=2 Tax=Ferrimonas gelatinilytica TaxID=1255257 RepID=A0ABP9RYF0_9GAMM
MDEAEGWVNLLQNELPETRLINAAVSGETTDGALRRLPALLTEHSPEWIFVELGGNDGLRGFPLSVTEQNLRQIIELGLASNSKVMLSEILLPPNYGRRYTQAFQSIFPRLADEYEVVLVPFFMADIATDPALMQADGIHPNRAAQPLIVETIKPWFRAPERRSMTSKANAGLPAGQTKATP